jgi:CheY-like chemotaxis protein
MTVATRDTANEEIFDGRDADRSRKAIVLIVDDHLVERRFAGGLVEQRTGVSTLYASNGREALELLDLVTPAAIITDLQMPELDGLQLVEQVRLRHPEIPTIVVTAYGSEEISIRALRAGAAQYVPKRTLERDLVPTLERVLALAAEGRSRRHLHTYLDHRDARFRIGNDPSLFTPLIDMVRDDLQAIGLGDATVRTRIGVALQEALANALYHGNLEVSSDLRQDDERLFFNEAEIRREQSPYQNRMIDVHFRIGRDFASFVIRDEGPGFDTTTLDRPIEPEDLLRVGGRGFLLIRSFMDEVSHNAAGNEITMLKHGAS